MQFKRRRTPGTCLYDKADKGYKERVRTENAWQAIDIALRHEECKNNDFKLNDFKYKTHSKSSSAVFNLREKSITNTWDSADKTGKGGVG